MTIQVNVTSFIPEFPLVGDGVTVTTDPLTPAPDADRMIYLAGTLGDAPLDAVVIVDQSKFTEYSFVVPEVKPGEWYFDFRFMDGENVYHFRGGPVSVSGEPPAPEGPPPTITGLQPATVTSFKFSTQPFRVIGNHMEKLNSFHFQRASGENPPRINASVRTVGNQIVVTPSNATFLTLKAGSYWLVGETEDGVEVRSRRAVTITPDE